MECWLYREDILDFGFYRIIILKIFFNHFLQTKIAGFIVWIRSQNFRRFKLFWVFCVDRLDPSLQQWIFFFCFFTNCEMNLYSRDWNFSKEKGLKVQRETRFTIINSLRDLVKFPKCFYGLHNQKYFSNSFYFTSLSIIAILLVDMQSVFQFFEIKR